MSAAAVKRSSYANPIRIDAGVGLRGIRQRVAAEAPPVEPEAPIISADEYRRQARRLRQKFAGQPEFLHASLLDLSKRYDRSRRLASLVTPAPQTRRAGMKVQTTRAHGAPDAPLARAVVDWFADQVADEINGNMIHGSNREHLMKVAERLGISRFNANMLMAVAQHNAAATHSAAHAPAKAVTRTSFVPIIVLITVMQAAIAWGVWRVLHG